MMHEIVMFLINHTGLALGLGFLVIVTLASMLAVGS